MVPMRKIPARRLVLSTERKKPASLRTRAIGISVF
jgi:hypothetical protein